LLSTILFLTHTILGPNVVVKGPPYLPSTSGDSQCSDLVTAECQAAGTCETCYTFNQADVDHIQSMGYNSIRLSVVWAGAQPTKGGPIDADFAQRLHDILDLTDANGVHVILDNHGDMVGTLGCGNGVPAWFQAEAAPDLVGKRLTTGLPYSLFVNVKDVGGYDADCDWSAHAGDPNYNILNECCLAMNGPNPGGLGYTHMSQKTMDYMINPGAGRDQFVDYWKKLADEVVDHPSAVGFELMNEPMTIYRKHAFNTWRAAAEVITAIIPDASVAICDTGEAPLIPDWVTKYYPFGDIRIDSDTEDYIKASQNLFYAWHWYGAPPKTAADAVKNAQAISKEWNVPSFATEFMSCDVWNAAVEAGISHSWWHYSCYCDTNEIFSAKGVVVPDTSFGACILGWGGGNANYGPQCSSMEALK